MAANAWLPLSETSNSSECMTLGQKRPHAEEPLTASGRAKQTKQDLLALEARHVGRAMDAFLSPGAMFNYGMEAMATAAEMSVSPEDLKDINSEQRRWIKIYKHLCSKIPHFEARIIDADAPTFREHEKLFKAGLSAARSDDIASLKSVIIDWLCAPPYYASTLTNPLQRNVKSTRGFHNPVIGKLLCPTDLDWNDPAVQQGLREGTIEVHHSQWPNFLYVDGTPPAEDEDMWNGFLRHPLLVKTLKHIYTSPSSVDGSEGSRAMRSSKAYLAGMKGITAGAIADAIVKLRHSLSSYSTFQKNDRSTHNELFYYGLLEVLEAEQSQFQMRELLRWYDRQLFPGQATDDEPLGNSALARMRAQLGIGAN